MDLDIEAERKLFESNNPVPKHVTWAGNGYASTEYGAWSAHDYCRKFEGFKERAALARPIRSEADVNRTAQFYKDERNAANIRIAELERQLAAVATALQNPAAWVVFAENGNCRIWFADYKSACQWAGDNAENLVPLYTAPPPAAPVLKHNQEIFTVSILRTPIREYAPGKWEAATWPSDTTMLGCMLFKCDKK